VVDRLGLSLRPELRLKLKLEPDLPAVRIDESQLAFALENLLDNAIAAAGDRGEVTIATRRAGPGRISLDVADNGPGIPEEDRKRLFEQFFTRKQEGTGLGLMIVKKVVEDHGAQVKVESVAGKGTRVTVTFATI